MLRLDDAWIWDSWIADDGERYHLFFLKAPRETAARSRCPMGRTTSRRALTRTVPGHGVKDQRLGLAESEPTLFAAPLVQQRDGTWAFVGFRNQEPEGILSFEILDPIRVALRDGALQGR